jgi:hypothetical protein
MIELHFPDPVTSEHGFFNRQREWALVEKTLRSREKPLIILGERRIGKTSLQSVAAKRLKADAALEPLFLPFGSLMRSTNDLARELLQGLCASVGQDARETGLFDADGSFCLHSFGEYTQALRNVSGQGRDFLVCVDEFDATLKNCDDKQAKKLAALVTHLSNQGGQGNLPLGFFFSMTGIPETVTQSFGTSLASNAALLELEPFSDANTAKMVRTLLQPARISADALTQLAHLSGGHPYITKLLLYWLLEPRGFDAQGLTVDQAGIEQAAAEALKDAQAREVLTNIYDVHLDAAQKNLMLMLAHPECRDGLTKEELQTLDTSYITAAKTLKRRGYLKTAGRVPVQGGANAPYRLRIAFLGLWLYQWERYEVEVEKRNVKPGLCQHR